jgi:hypothetical protein
MELNKIDLNKTVYLENLNTVKPPCVEHVDNWFLKIYLLK